MSEKRVKISEKIGACQEIWIPRSILEKFKTIQMIDVSIPTLDGRVVEMPRYTQPDTDLQLLLHQLKLFLPKQPMPRVSKEGLVSFSARSSRM